MMNTVFTEEQFRHIYPDGIEDHFWNHARNKIILRFLKECEIDREVILEIGGGRGIVTRFLHNNQLNITGVELADITPVKGVETYFYTGTNAFHLNESFRDKVSVILLLDVIEHIKEPRAFIGQIVNAFPNLRHLVVTVPARQELWTNFDAFNGHYMRYSLDDLKLLKPGTLRYKHGQYFNHLLYPIFWFFAGSGKKREEEIKPPKGWFKVLHRILSLLLQFDYQIIPGGIRGTSCIAWFSQ